MLNKYANLPLEERRLIIIPEKQIIVDSTLRNLYVGDGITPGGVAATIPVKLQGPTSVISGDQQTYQIVEFSSFSKYEIHYEGQIYSPDIDGNFTLTFNNDDWFIVYRDGVGRDFSVTLSYPDIEGIFTQLGNVGPALRDSSFVVGESIIYVFGGRNGSDEVSNFWSYDIPSQQYNDLPTTPPARYRHGCVFYEGKIYLLGGVRKNGSYSDMWVFDISKTEWMQLQNTPTTLNSPVMCQLNGDIYVFSSNGNRFQKFNIAGQTWVDLQLPPAVGSYPSLTVVGEKLYLFGGVWINDQLWTYDTVSDTWSQLASGPPGRYGHSATTHNGKIYIFGGSGGTDDLWIYDPETDIWSLLANGATSRSYSHMGTDDSKLFLYGGFSGTDMNDLWAIE